MQQNISSRRRSGHSCCRQCSSWAMYWQLQKFTTTLKAGLILTQVCGVKYPWLGHGADGASYSVFRDCHGIHYWYVCLSFLTNPPNGRLIGFGDYVPKTHLGRSLAFPMVIGGILFVGFIIGSIRTLVLQGGSTKVSRRMLEWARQRALQSLDHENGTIRVGLFRKHDVGNSAATQIERRRQEFDTMRKVQHRARRVNQLLALGVSAGA